MSAGVLCTSSEATKLGLLTAVWHRSSSWGTKTTDPLELAEFMKPTDEEVVQAIREAEQNSPGIGLQKLVQAVRVSHPDWSPAVNSKRLREVRKAITSTPAPPSATPSHDAVPGQESVMSAYMGVLARLCSGGDEKAAQRAVQIDMTLKLDDGVMRSTNPRLPPPSAFVKRNHQASAGMYPMRSCKLATTLALLVGAPDEEIIGCIAWMARSLGGLPTARDVLEMPSADVRSVYARAEARARGQGEMTLLAVGLVDVELLLRGEGLVPGGTDYESFSHTFVMVVAPEGVRVLQAWGEHGYSLGNNLASSASRVRTFVGAREYVQDFESLCAKKGPWSREINGLYLKLFGVDVIGLGRSGGPMTRAMSPKFRAWVRVKEGREVRIEDVQRWEGIVDAIDARFRI